MNLPNVHMTSGTQTHLKIRKARYAFLVLALCPALFCSCHSSESLSSRAANHPYAQNDPRTPEEEAYYNDVYSGDWKEQNNPFGMGKSICKKSGTTSMPSHWEAMPPGAQTLDEIRAKAARQKSSYPTAPTAAQQNLGQIRNEYSSAPLNPAYSAQTTTSPVSTATPQASQTSVIPSQNVAQTYAGATQRLVQTLGTTAQNASQIPTATLQASVAAAQTVAQTTGSAPVYVAMAPTATTQGAAQTSVIPPQYANAQPVSAQFAVQNQIASVAGAAQNKSTGQQVPAASSVPTYAPAQNAVPAQTTPVVTPTQNATYTGATVERSVYDYNGMKNWIVRGQESEEDPFLDEDEEDAESVDSPVANDSKDADVPKANVSETKTEVLKEKNVKETILDSNAAVAEQKVSESKVENVPATGRPGQVDVQNVKIDPSIAEPFKDFHQSVGDVGAPANSNASRSAQDEYVISGGDSKGKMYSREDWSVENLDPEDTAAHFDTTDGRILSEPANRVFLYSPRFGSVRQVVGPIEGDHRLALETTIVNNGATEGEQTAAVDVRTQDVKLLGATGVQDVVNSEAGAAPLDLDGGLGVIEASAQIKLGAMLTEQNVENLSSEDSALMMSGALAAQAWDGEQGVAVSTDLVNAFSNAYIEGPATIFAIKDGTVTSKLRVIKIANKTAAKPGEFVEFTLRFENIGDEPIGNVTILDNLSARLRYVDGTAKSSVQADFLADLSETGSLVLRWEIAEPLQPKEFGVVQFICKVQ